MLGSHTDGQWLSCWKVQLSNKMQAAPAPASTPCPASASPLPCISDINECEHRNHTCTLQQTCYNTQGGFKCIDPIRCEEPYLRISDK